MKKGFKRIQADANRLNRIQTELFSLMLIAVSLISCGDGSKQEGSDQEIIQTLPNSPINGVVTAALSEEDLVSVLNGISIANINQYIHPENGLWLVQSPGAMPSMSNTTQVDKNFPVDFSAVKDEELPKVNCDSKSLWTKEGCYAQEINSFNEERIWIYCGLSKEDLAKVGDIAKTISWTVINTSLGARYYFSMIDGKWYLTVVDLRKPCAA
jgi:hypothetical protein